MLIPAPLSVLSQPFPSPGSTCRQRRFKYPRLESRTSTVSSGLGQTQGSHSLEIPEEPGFAQYTPSGTTCDSSRILERKSWAWAPYLSHDLPRGWSVRCIQDLPNKQRLESFPYDAGERTGLQTLHHIIAIRTCDDERQMFTCVLTDLWELTGLWSQRDSPRFKSLLYHLIAT